MLETLQMHWTYKFAIDTILSNIVHIVNRIINLYHFVWSTTHQFLTNKQDREKKNSLASSIHSLEIFSLSSANFVTWGSFWIISKILSSSSCNSNNSVRLEEKKKKWRRRQMTKLFQEKNRGWKYHKNVIACESTTRILMCMYGNYLLVLRSGKAANTSGTLSKDSVSCKIQSTMNN